MGHERACERHPSDGRGGSHPSCIEATHHRHHPGLAAVGCLCPLCSSYPRVSSVCFMRGMSYNHGEAAMFTLNSRLQRERVRARS